MKRAILPGAVLAIVLAAHGAPRAQSPAPAEPAKAVAAIVNGEEILGADIALMYENLPAQYRQIPLGTIYRQLLERLIDQKLVAAAAREAGLLDDPRTKRRLAFMSEALLHQLYLEAVIEEKVTEGALRTAYENRKGATSAAEEVRARHILVKTEAEAVAIIKELQGGADFAALARDKSIGPSSRQGGDLGFFAFGQMVRPFSEAAFKLKPGETTTTPVKTRFGWHVIKVEERRAAGGRSFAESREALRNELIQATVNQTIARLRAKADIQMLRGGNIQPAP